MSPQMYTTYTEYVDRVVCVYIHNHIHTLQHSVSVKYTAANGTSQARTLTTVLPPPEH